VTVDDIARDAYLIMFSMDSIEERYEYIDMMYDTFNEIKDINFITWDNYRLFIDARFGSLEAFGVASSAHKATLTYYNSVGALGEALNYNPHVIRYIIPKHLESIINYDHPRESRTNL